MSMIDDETLEAMEANAESIGVTEVVDLIAEVKRLRLIVQPSTRAQEIARTFQAKRAEVVKPPKPPVLAESDRVRLLETNVAELEASHRIAFERARTLENAIATALRHAANGSTAAALAELRGVLAR